MRRCVVVLFAAATVCSLFAQKDTPPKGVAWYETIQSAQAAVYAKHLPLLIFCHNTTFEDSNKMYAYFERPLIQAICRHFVCLFLNEAYNRDAYRQAYVPYLAATPNQNIRAPVLTICNTAVWPQREFRIEGNCPDFDRFAAHLEHALRKLAPEEFSKFLTERAPQAPWRELAKRIENCHVRATDDTNKQSTYIGQLRAFLKALQKRIKTNLSSKRAKPLLKLLSKYYAAVKRIPKKPKARKKALQKAEAAFSAFLNAFKKQAERMRVYLTCGKPGHPMFRQDAEKHPKRCPLCKKPLKPFEFDPDDVWGCGEKEHPKYFRSHPAKCPVCKKKLREGG